MHNHSEVAAQQHNARSLLVCFVAFGVRAEAAALARQQRPPARYVCDFSVRVQAAREVQPHKAQHHEEDLVPVACINARHTAGGEESGGVHSVTHQAHGNVPYFVQLPHAS